MKALKIKTFDYLRNNNLSYVKISSSFKQYVKNDIINKYGSLNKFSKELNIPMVTLAQDFSIKKYIKFGRLLNIIKYIGIRQELLDGNVLAFFAKGSNTPKELFLPKYIEINEFLFFIMMYMINKKNTM